MGSFVLRLLTADDTAAFLKLKQIGLATSPESFVATIEEDPPDYAEQVRQRLARSSVQAGDAVVGAFDPELIGIVAVTRETHHKRAHKAHLHGMFVVPERRGLGLGRGLLTEVLRLARQMDGLEEIQLVVAVHNREAAALYRRFGFVETWTETRALRLSDRYVDAIHMSLRLLPPTLEGPAVSLGASGRFRSFS